MCRLAALLLTFSLAVPVRAQELTNVKSQDLHFGSAIYPFRRGNDIHWLISEARALGLTELRVGYERNLVERANQSTHYDPANYRDPKPEVFQALRRSGLEVTLTLLGPGADSKGRAIDFPRRSDGTIDGAVAGQGFANYVRWVCDTTHDFVAGYELWNEAFNTMSVRALGQGFGAGGSTKNADSYSQMMLPALQAIRQHAPKAAVLVEGNYWNIPAVKASAGYLELLQKTDFCVYHPYNYNPEAYNPGHALGDIRANVAQHNPNVRWWYSEYGLGPKAVKIAQPNWSEKGQAKAYLRMTVLHLSRGVQHLDPFALYYPSSPEYSFLHPVDRRRRQVFLAMHRLIDALEPRHPSSSESLSRSPALPPGLQDLAIDHMGGFTYLVWQETSPNRFEQNVPAQEVSLYLTASPGRPLQLVRVLDPITGREVAVTAKATDRGLRLSLMVPDYPLICLVR